MTVSNHFLLHAVERMANVTAVSYRRIFNGYGIYHLHVQFAIIVNDHLYFRADDYSRDLYLAKKMTAFLPRKLEAVESNFFQLPEDVLNNPEELVTGYASPSKPHNPAIPLKMTSHPLMCPSSTSNFAKSPAANPMI